MNEPTYVPKCNGHEYSGTQFFIRAIPYFMSVVRTVWNADCFVDCTLSTEEIQSTVRSANGMKGEMEFRLGGITALKTIAGKKDVSPVSDEPEWLKKNSREFGDLEPCGRDGNEERRRSKDRQKARGLAMHEVRNDIELAR